MNEQRFLHCACAIESIEQRKLGLEPEEEWTDILVDLNQVQNVRRVYEHPNNQVVVYMVSGDSFIIDKSFEEIKAILLK